MSLHVLILTAEIIPSIIAGLWATAFGIAGIRRLIHGPDVFELVDAAFVAKYASRSETEGWPHRCLVAIDICCNVLCRGQEDETLSGRAYRASLKGKLWGKILNSWLGLIQVQHGVKALVGDLTRARARVIINEKVLGLA
jgi:hypothetical protein